MIERQWLQYIADIAYDRDGYKSAEDLGELVDELRGMALDGLQGKKSPYTDDPNDESMCQKSPYDTIQELKEEIECLKYKNIQESNNRYTWEKKAHKFEQGIRRIAAWRDMSINEAQEYREKAMDMHKAFELLLEDNKNLVIERDSALIHREYKIPGVDISSFLVGGGFMTVVLFIGMVLSRVIA